MTVNTLTLALGGEVPLDLFSQTIRHFQHLIELLSKEMGEGVAITWTVDELSAGSAVITIRGEAADPGVVERVGRAYTIIGQSLEEGKPIPYGPSVARAAENITKVLNGKITSIQFEAGSEVATVTAGVSVEQAAGLIGAFGSIEGRIETLTHRSWLGFTLYDFLNDRAIRCHLAPDQADSVREAWGRRAIVRGWVRRDPISGRPVAITPVHSIEVVPEVERGSYRRARGVAPAGPGEPSPEVAIRRLRDA
jgi:hypothetical protein